MKILWFTWKDIKNPLAGGAEVVGYEIAKQLTSNGHEVIFLVAGFKNGLSKEIIDGYAVIRLGNKWTVYWQAYKYYKKNLIGWADVVIDEVNTIPFFTTFYVKEKKILFFHQLCREIWFYESFFPLNLIGYLLEPFYLWSLSDGKVITVSESTKNDLLKCDFKLPNINIISEGINLKPLEDLNTVEKFTSPTLLSIGSIRQMKRTIDILKAFEILKKKVKDAKLIIAGNAESRYGRKLLHLLNRSIYKKDIEYLGKISSIEKEKLMQKSHILLITSVKEGWGLVVTEANSQGTPVVAYDADGIRDSIQNGETGIISRENNPESLSDSVMDIFKDKNRYEKIRETAWRKSKEINFERSYNDFIKIIENI